MMNRSIVLIGLFMIFVGSLVGQRKQVDLEAIKEQIIRDRLEFIAEQLETEDADFTVLVEGWNQYFNHPMNINKASRTELLSLGLLSEIQAAALVRHVEMNGKLIRLEELQTINTFDTETIRRILPFVQIGEDMTAARFSISNIFENGEHQLITRFKQVAESQKGYSTTEDSDGSLQSPKYRGDPYSLYSRYQFNYNNYVKFGLTTEKDAGEKLWDVNEKNRVDFLSGYVFVKDVRRLKRFVVGDFQAQFGQGLVYWSGYTMGKSQDVMSIKRNAQGLRPYTSVDENRFMRGVGATLGIGKTDLTVFYSKHRVDANQDLDSISDSGIPVVTSFQFTGYHRTEGEVLDKDAIDQEDIGVDWTYRTRSLTVGLTGVYRKYFTEYVPNTLLYKQFNDLGVEKKVVGGNYSWVTRNLNFFGEVATSGQNDWNMLSGVLMALDPKVSFSLYYRRFDKAFGYIESAAIGENTFNQNENGLYSGLIIKPNRKITLTGFIDRFSFPWLRYRVDAPSRGVQYFSQFTYKPNKRFQVYFRYKQRKRDQNPTTEDILRTPIIENQVNYRADLQYKFAKNWSIKNRVEWIEYEKDEKASGFMAYQDIKYAPEKLPFKLVGRIAYFDTDGYSSRIYAYENDVLYSFSIPAYSDKGLRYYAMLRYKVRKGIDLWLRYAVTDYFNRDQIGSGNDLIDGNMKSQITGQIRFKF